jgi:hypothetical protein
MVFIPRSVAISISELLKFRQDEPCEGLGNRKCHLVWTSSLGAEPETGRARQLMAEDRLPLQIDVLNQPVVTVV